MNRLLNIKHKSSKSQARLGQIETSHGTIQTPAFVPVGTKGTIKGLNPQLIKDIPVQLAFVNTYHLVSHPGVDVIQHAGGIHTFAKLNLPLMSDSAGFQVFSLATKKRMAKVRAEEDPMLVKITEDGVDFRSVYDGAMLSFTPEKSMDYQRKIGADILMAFDECTYYPATKEYAVKALGRSHAWLKRCVEYLDKNKPLYGYPQYLYGIIQGGTYEDLRKESAEFVVQQNTPGVAIGGVSVGETKEEMRKVVEWVKPYLPEDRPVHLLGVGQFDDIVDTVTAGIDTFDCVEPTRIARMGTIYNIEPFAVAQGKHETYNIKQFAREIDITKTVYKDNMERVDENCECYVCQNFTKAYLHHLFKQRELLGYTLATYHNLAVMEKFMSTIRELIAQDLL